MKSFLRLMYFSFVFSILIELLFAKFILQYLQGYIIYIIYILIAGLIWGQIVTCGHIFNFWEGNNSEIEHENSRLKRIFLTVSSQPPLLIYRVIMWIVLTILTFGLLFEKIFKRE
jgi:hypothetical protein